MAPPNPERQIHRACGDVRVALFEALELLSGTTAPRAGSDLGRIQRHVAVALHATNLLDQMVGIPTEHRPPWSYYRSRIGKDLGLGAPAHQDGCRASRFEAQRPLRVLDAAG
jgi:hypothetical protein